jgi:hypothetical protein
VVVVGEAGEWVGNEEGCNQRREELWEKHRGGGEGEGGRGSLAKSGRKGEERKKKERGEIMLQGGVPGEE